MDKKWLYLVIILAFVLLTVTIILSFVNQPEPVIMAPGQNPSITTTQNLS